MSDFPSWHPAAQGAVEELPGQGSPVAGSARVGHQYTGEEAHKSSTGSREVAVGSSHEEKKPYRYQRKFNENRKKGFRKPPAKYTQNSPFAPAFGTPVEEAPAKTKKPQKSTQFRADSRLSQPDTEEDLAAYALHGVGVPGREETAGRRGQKEPESEFTKAKNIVLNQLAMAPRSRAQLAKKLSDREISEATANDVLDRFEAVNLVNDAEFAEVYVRTRANVKKLSKNAIRRELKQKGVEGEAAEVALEQRSDADERSDAHELVAKKLRPSMDFSDRKERDKIMRRLVGMLARKGYPPSMAFSVVKEEIDRHIEENDLGSSGFIQDYF